MFVTVLSVPITHEHPDFTAGLFAGVLLNVSSFHFVQRAHIGSNWQHCIIYVRALV
jgi:ribonuclease BN (tRNA processing enzyme)